MRFDYSTIWDSAAAIFATLSGSIGGSFALSMACSGLTNLQQH